jgi:hypothetical protein
VASSVFSPTFHIGTIHIGSIEAASCFSIGNNFLEDFQSSKKHNQGLGNIHGNRNNFSRMSASLTHAGKGANGNEEESSDAADTEEQTLH